MSVIGKWVLVIVSLVTSVIGEVRVSLLIPEVVSLLYTYIEVGVGE